MPAVDGSDETHALCWLCAHAVVTHDVAIGQHVPHCECLREDIYPADVIARREACALVDDAPEDRTQIVVPAKMSAPPKGPVYTLITPSRNERGHRDDEGPVLVQQFRKLEDDRIELVSAEVRPRIKRAARRVIVKH